MVQVGMKDIPTKKGFKLFGLLFRIRKMLMISPAPPTTIPSVIFMLTLALLNFNLA